MRRGSERPPTWAAQQALQPSVEFAWVSDWRLTFQADREAPKPFRERIAFSRPTLICVPVGPARDACGEEAMLADLVGFPPQI
jgi:hypothetical protein